MQNKPARPWARGIILATAALTLGACGGDGGSSNPIRYINDTDTNWTAGEFREPAYFANQCEDPRRGIDPATGRAYPDTDGSALAERHFLRSWSNDTYLWYDEIVDRNPANYSDTLTYFDLLKTEELTASGAPKDNFHFTMPTAEWNQLSQSGTSVSYGAMWTIISALPPRELRVAYVEPDSPAAEAGIARGDTIISIDGVNVVNGDDVDALNAGLSPSDEGESHDFVIRDVAGVEQDITLTATTVTSEPVLDYRVIEPGVGYILFNDHIATAEEQLIEAVDYLDSQNITELVLDLRYNGGGYLAIASQLAYMIAGPSQTSGEVFESVIFNDKHAAENDDTPFYDETVGLSSLAAGQPLPHLDLARVAVITSANTCSASEAIINGLRGVDVEVIQIGDTTCGKPYGYYPADNCGTTYFTIQFQGVNAKGFGDYPDGFSPAGTLSDPGEVVPGCHVPNDDFDNLLGDPDEERIAAALHYLDAENCAYPVSTTFSARLSKPAASPSSASGSGLLMKSPALQGRALHRQPGADW